MHRIGLRALLGPAWYERPMHQPRGKLGMEWGLAGTKSKEKEAQETKERETRRR
jgi:hypothetical protein